MKANLLNFASSLVIVFGIVSQTTSVAAADDTGVLTVGEHTVLCWSGLHVELLYGYMQSRPLGSYSPTTLKDGKTIVEVYDQTDRGCKLVTGSKLSVSGFSSDPGRSWLKSVSCNRTSLSSLTAARFIFSNGTATWEWVQKFGFESSEGRDIQCSIDHE